MESIGRTNLAKVLYGMLFVVVLPAALVLWAHATRDVVHLPAIHSLLWGDVLAAFGIGAMLAGMVALWRKGGGLPMNAFPPARFVEGGIYGLVPHPIYGGFVLACASASFVTGSASGLWLVTPTVAVASAALVLGYEAPDLRERFGARSFSLWLPRDRQGAPSLVERVRVVLVVLLPWLALFELLWRMGPQTNAVSTFLPFENRLPVIEQSEIIYASTYVVVICAPLMILSGAALRHFAQRALTAMAIVFPLYVVLPVFVPPRPFHSAGVLGQLLAWERTPYSGVGAFPSFHVLWALIAASALGEGGRSRRYAWWTWAVLVVVSCVTTGMHSIADVLAGVAVYLLVVRMKAIWLAMLRVAGRIANSWREWRIGRLRIINHGGYAAVAAFVGMALVGALLGPSSGWIVGSICLCSIVGAALWAQWVEGSPALLRPMGFYGGMLGAVVGAVPAVLAHVDLWFVLGAICVGAPWIQGIGRLRCLVQGCCHGRATESMDGIRYTHSRTRVCRLAHLGGVPIHATQVYSMACNAVVGLALLRLLELHVSAPFLCGIYLLLSGAGRFVEEAYRGEPQTMTVCGLHLYQWIAAGCMVAGAVLTCVRGAALTGKFDMRISTILIAFGCGAIAWFVTGMDFPESSRRFARLT